MAAILACSFLAFITFLVVRRAPVYRVPRLLSEMQDIPHGNVVLFYGGRSFEDIEAELDRIGAARVPELITCLRDKSPTIRFLAAGQLGRAQDVRAIPPLGDQLQVESEAMVLCAIIRALGELKSASSVNDLIQRATSRNPNIRKAAIVSLGQIGDSHALDTVISATRDDDLSTRCAAISALGMLGDSRVETTLLEILERDDSSLVRSLAARSLGRAGGARTVAALHSAANDPSWRVSEAAQAALLQRADRTPTARPANLESDAPATADQLR